MSRSFPGTKMGKKPNGTVLLGLLEDGAMSRCSPGVPQAWRSLGPTPGNSKLGRGSLHLP